MDEAWCGESERARRTMRTLTPARRCLPDLPRRVIPPSADWERHRKGKMSGKRPRETIGATGRVFGEAPSRSHGERLGGDRVHADRLHDANRRMNVALFSIHETERS